MKHLAVTESELHTLLFALRCGEKELLDHINEECENPGPNALEMIRKYFKMRSTLIRFENQLEPEE